VKRHLGETGPSKPSGLFLMAGLVVLVACGGADGVEDGVPGGAVRVVDLVEEDRETTLESVPADRDRGFDPLVTPSASGVDLVRLREVVDSLVDPVECPQVEDVESLEDVVEVLRLVDGCLVLEYVVLGGRSVEEVAAGYKTDSGVLAIARPLLIAVDSNHLDDPEAVNQWHLVALEAEKLWAGWPPGAEVRVAVIDTGVDGAHHDLDDNLVMWGDDANLRDGNGHGTHVAGIIAAEAGNGIGGAGVAPEASLISIRFGEFQPNVGVAGPDQRSFRTLAGTIAEARRSGARVVNMSIHMQEDSGLRADALPDWCGEESALYCGDPAAWQLRVGQAEGVIFVASAGNCGPSKVANCKYVDQIQWPAAYEGVIGVGSVDLHDLPSPFSTAGPHVDIAAPGQDIVSNLPGNGFGIFRWNRDRTGISSGTSMAAPVVSAVIAHLIARFPDATYQEITDALYQTARNVDLFGNPLSGRTNELGWGIIQPLDAIQHLHNSRTPPTTAPATTTPATTTPTAAPTTTAALTTTTTVAPTAEGFVSVVASEPHAETGDESAEANAAGFAEVSAGSGHSCGIRTDNTAACWGKNWSGEADAPSGMFISVSAGHDHSCGLRTDNTAICWGSNEHDQAYAPSGTFISVSAGTSHSCGLRTDNTAICWGDIWAGRADAPSGTFISVSAGGSHSCGIRTDNTAICWGSNEYGQAYAPSGTFISVSAGGWHSCGIRTDNTAICWGANFFGKADAPSGVFISVSAGSVHSCGIRTDNTTVCWGSNEYGQAYAPSGTFISVSAGTDHSCGIRTDNTAICWGSNEYGPADAPSGTFTTVSAGGLHSCGLRTDNTAICWGNSTAGQAYAPSGTFISVSAGEGHSCGIRTDNTAICWGRSWHWYGTADVPSGAFISVTAGTDHSCGIRTDNTAICWGNNSDGKADAPSGTFTTVSAGDGHSCGIRTDNTAICWGNNGSGQVDAPSGAFTTVSAGTSYSCGIRTDNTAICWGNNSDGKADAPSGTFTTVSAGRRHSCGIRTDNTAICWGDNQYGKADAPSETFISVSAGEGHSCGIRTDNTAICWRPERLPEGVTWQTQT